MRVRYRLRSRIVLTVLTLAAFAAIRSTALCREPADPTDLLHGAAPSTWRTCTGAWAFSDGVARMDASCVDGLIVHRTYRPASASLTIDVGLAGSGGSLLFGLDDTLNATAGHFVRMVAGTIETGCLRGTSGEQLTGRAAVRQNGDGWTNLSVSIDQSARTYEILADGRQVMETQELVCPGGWIGLRSLDASAAFRNLVIRQAGAARAAGRQARDLSVHRLRYVRAGAGNLVVHDPERNLLLAMDLQGKLLKSAPPRFPVRATTEVTAAGRRYAITGGVLTITPGSGRPGAAGADTVRAPLVQAAALVADRDGTVYVTDAGDPAVHQVEPSGKVVRTWRAKLLGGFIAPHGIDLLGTKELAVADYDRVVILTKGKDEETPEITAGAKGIVVEWTLPSAVTPYAEVSDDGSAWTRVTGEGKAAGGRARVVLGGLEPATTYLIRFGPVVKTIPASAGVSRVLEASTLARDASSAEAR